MLLSAVLNDAEGAYDFGKLGEQFLGRRWREGWGILVCYSRVLAGRQFLDFRD